ncbi:MAG: hypothetical protein U0470_04750 [Anaerolineae bacterium]
MTSTPAVDDAVAGPWMRRQRRIRAAWLCVTASAALVTGSALAAYALSALRLAIPGHDVELGFADVVMADAASWRFAGHALYGVLGDGYAGPPYAPAMPVLVGALLGARMWNGWPLLITYVAALALVALAFVDRGAPVAATPAGGRRVIALTAVLAPAHLVALPLIVPLALLHEGRADVAAWALAMLAVVFADRADRVGVVDAVDAVGADRLGRRGARFALAAGVAAGLGFAFKQSALIAVPAIVIAAIARHGLARRDQARRAAIRRRLALFIGSAAAALAAILGGVAWNSGRVGVGAVLFDGPAFDRALGWGTATATMAVMAAPPLASWLAAQWTVRRSIGAAAWRAGLEGHAAVCALAVLGVPAAAALLRFDGSDSNQCIGVALAWTWSMARTARTAAASSALGAAAAVVCLLGIASFASPSWQRAAQPRLAGFSRTAPLGPLAVFRAASPRVTTDLARFAADDALALVCGDAAAGRPAASFYDPRKPYRDTVRTGRIAPNIIGLVDGYAIGRGPAAPLLADIERRAFACIVEPELLDRPAWLDYVGADHAADFAMLGQAVRRAYAPSGLEFEGRSVWWPRP